MARMPGARWLGEHAPVQSDGTRLRMSRYDAVCIHTIVGFAPAHAAHFSVHHDGTIDQSRDTRYRSGANLQGNHRVIAIENEDHGAAFGRWDTDDGHAVPPFTAAQIEANAKILAWAHKTHGIPLQLCPNSRSTSRGLAYHRQGIDGNFDDYDYPGRVAGGEIWTKSFGKVCPGDRRISARDRILARAKQIVSGTTPKPPQPPLPTGDPDMSLLIQKGASVGILLQGDRALSLPIADAVKIRDQSKAQGNPVPLVTGLSAEAIATIQANLISEVDAAEEAPAVP
jgi:N-acetylmuramoyl-L-alanine amidase